MVIASRDGMVAIRIFLIAAAGILSPSALDSALAQGRSAPAEASDGWLVTLVEGGADWRPLSARAQSNSWNPLRRGERVEPPAEVETDAEGAVALLRGDDIIRIGPDTRLSLAAAAGPLTRVKQVAGAIWYRIRTLATRRFEVEGRYLVAAVKGTRFRVVMGPMGDMLSVQEGVVAAAPRGGGRTLDVRAGQAVLATASGIVIVAPPGGDGPAAPAGGIPEPPGDGSDVQGPSGRTGKAHDSKSGEKHNHGRDGGGKVSGEHGDNPDRGKGGSGKGRGPKK